MSERNSRADSDSSRKPGDRRRFFGGLALGGLLGTFAMSSFSLWANDRGPDGGQGRHWCRAHGGAAATPEQRAARADAMTERMLTRVDATTEQKTRIKSIVQDALKDLAQTREEHVKNRQAFVEALKQPSVDRAALKQIREAELKLAESASDRLINAIADAADVLTPEQRGKLAQMAERFRR
jgi:periplasmic protein CpxP/Spy